MEKTTKPTALDIIQTNPAQKKKNSLPEKKIRAGAISATIWQNNVEREGKVSSFNSISLERVYKDKEGNWQSTNTFRTNDLPKLASCSKSIRICCIQSFSTEA